MDCIKNKARRQYNDWTCKRHVGDTWGKPKIYKNCSKYMAYIRPLRHNDYT